MKELKNFRQLMLEEDGMGTVEVILILSWYWWDW